MPIPSAEPEPCLLDCRVPGGVAVARAVLTGSLSLPYLYSSGADKQANINKRFPAVPRPGHKCSGGPPVGESRKEVLAI